jgi:hypothetical protein
VLSRLMNSMSEARTRSGPGANIRLRIVKAFVCMVFPSQPWSGMQRVFQISRFLFISGFVGSSGHKRDGATWSSGLRGRAHELLEVDDRGLSRHPTEIVENPVKTAAVRVAILEHGITVESADHLGGALGTSAGGRIQIRMTFEDLESIRPRRRSHQTTQKSSPHAIS